MKLSKPHEDFKIVAHRGLSEAFPENTGISYKAALMRDVDFVEIDLHLSRDGVLVAMHDEDVDRTTAHSGQISTYSLEELKDMDIGSWKNETFKNERILTFKEILAIFKLYNKSILVEIKKPRLYPGIEAEIIKDIEACDFNKDQVVIQSFNADSIRKVRELDPTFRLGVLISASNHIFSMPDFESISQYADYVNPRFMMINKRFVKKAHEHQLKVMPYTVNLPKDVKRVIKCGVDGVISDRPEALFDI